MPSGQGRHAEREPYVRWQVQREAANGTGEGQVAGQGVLQGQFVEVKFGKAIYEKKVKEALREMFELGDCYGDNPLRRHGDIEKIYELFMDYIVEGKENKEGREFGHDVIYEELDKIAQLTQSQGSRASKIIARLDILLDFIKNFDGETSTSNKKESPGASRYTHYHMYGEGTTLTKGDRVEDDADLHAAIDCDFSNISHGGAKLANTLWIESFISFQKGAGKELLRNVLCENDTIENVALGAYPGTETYYTDTLGMTELKNIYIHKDGKTYLTTEEALKKVMSEDEQAEKIKQGIEQGDFYPVYHASTQTVMGMLRGG